MIGQRLAEAERVRLLAAMGFETWRRRDPNALPLRTPEAVAPVRPRADPRSGAVPAPAVAAVLATAPLATATVITAINAAPTPTPTPRTQAQRAPWRGDAVLLVLEHRREADAPLLRALARVLPGCTVCTPDTVPQGVARFAVQVGMAAPLPSDVLGVRVPTLAELRGSAAARRALWWAIKPLLKPLSS